MPNSTKNRSWPINRSCVSSYCLLDCSIQLTVLRRWDKLKRIAFGVARFLWSYCTRWHMRLNISHLVFLSGDLKGKNADIHTQTHAHRQRTLCSMHLRCNSNAMMTNRMHKDTKHQMHWWMLLLHVSCIFNAWNTLRLDKREKKATKTQHNPVLYYRHLISPSLLFLMVNKRKKKHKK